MKKKILYYLYIFIVSSTHLYADEGMWLPQLLQEINEKDMQAAGLQLNTENLFGCDLNIYFRQLSILSWVPLATNR